ncbi:Cas10/Cmr2 second palm domain-containing protein [Geobacillus sp. YF-1]|uniref:Cas10/Cmr2 second palm domain-containing protein n=1 Tax=Geobacillus sp. YF-1 TaxID=3457480 RepID=UPI0040456CBC
MYRYVAVSDTNNVLSYIFSNTRYKFIRGASALLDYLNLHVTRKIAARFHGTVLSLGGGEARVLFRTKQEAEAYEYELRKAYLEHTDEVTLSIAVVERREGEFIAAWLERAEAMLRVKEKEKDKKVMPLLPLFPLVERCEGCAKRPAEKHYDMPDGKKIMLCLSCYKKAYRVDKIIENLKKYSKGEMARIHEETGLMDIHRKLIEQKGKEGSTWVRKIADIFGSDERTSRYIGFVYADGKKLGALFRQTILDNLQGQDDDEFVKRYKTYSETVHDCIVQSAAIAQQTFSDYMVDYAMVGGDDFVAIMPGEIALAYTNTFIQTFERLTGNAFFGSPHQRGVMMGAGVVIAHIGYPLYRMFQMSYDLMYRAKQKYANKSAIDFMILTDSTVQGVETIKYYENTSIRTGVPLENRYVRMNGYMVDREHNESIDKLLTVISKLKAAKFPRSKIEVLYEILREDNDYQMRFEWLKWRARMSADIKKIFDEWHGMFKETPFPFVYNGAIYSPLLDLFDLYDIVQMVGMNHDEGTKN